jgi:hypothetical protein
MLITASATATRYHHGGIAAFVVPASRHRNNSGKQWRSTMMTTTLENKQLWQLWMGKGFNRAKNKQAELAKKMAMAKKEKQEPSNSVVVDPTTTTTTTSDDVNNVKDGSNRMDDREHEVFAKLLSTTKGALPTIDDTNSAFIAPIKVGQGKKKQVIKPPPPPPPKKKKPKDPKDEKVAQRQYFESLIDVETSSALGPIGAAQLVPWVPPYLTDCMVVFADPRTSSGDLRQTLKYLASNLKDQDEEQKLTKQVIFITADSVQETQS